MLQGLAPILAQTRLSKVRICVYQTLRSALISCSLQYFNLTMSTRVRNPEIYVKGYGKDITKDDLKSWFREFGKIACIQYKGPYAFIEFEDYYDAETAVKQMNDKKVEGFRLTVEPSGKKRVNSGGDRDRNRSRSRSRDRRDRRHRRRSPSSSSSSSSSSRSSSSSSSSVSKDRKEEKKKDKKEEEKQK